jgi:hypothetical protein
MIDIKLLAVLPQRQDSVLDQLADLRLIANRFGMYDAADAILQWCDNLPKLLYGCYCDIEEGQLPDECVIDKGEIYNCTFAEEDMRKEQCKYWRIINFENIKSFKKGE